VQVDGEPWLQPPAVVRLSPQGKIPFVLGRGTTLNVPPLSHGGGLYKLRIQM
jgi:hypothetical protein